MITEILLSIAVTVGFAWIALTEYVGRLSPVDSARPDSADSPRPVQILLAASMIGGNVVIWTAGLIAR